MTSFYLLSRLSGHVPPVHGLRGAAVCGEQLTLTGLSLLPQQRVVFLKPSTHTTQEGNEAFTNPSHGQKYQWLDRLPATIRERSASITRLTVSGVTCSTTLRKSS